jgi:phospholipid/cholesterol/gamma-HCH transport system permease protein
MITQLIKQRFETIGKITELFIQFTNSCFSKPFYLDRVFEQVVRLGIGSLSISLVIGIVTGMVMTLQFGYGLEKFGGTLYVPAIVSMSIMRELGPIFTSLLIAGRVGSGISAEIGAMNVTQQIDALRALGTSPIRVLVVPRVLATVISLPLLAMLSTFSGILGGLVIAQTEFNIPPGFYLNKVFSSLSYSDIFGSMFKCVFFALIITLLACYKGFHTKEGTKGVGNTTIWVVVNSSIIILISDFFLTKFLILLF